MRLCNREGFDAYNVEISALNRRSGVSAMVRIRDEEEWIYYSLLSIKDWIDEIVVVFNNSKDASEEIVRSMNLDTVRIYQYPFDCFANGPEYEKNPEDTVYSRTYFYNWCLSKTSCSWVCKWDGDMVGMDWLGREIKDRIVEGKCDTITLYGVDIVGKELRRVGERVYTGAEPRVFKVTDKTFYKNGKFTECFCGPRGKTVSIDKPAFLHFKWAKKIESATCAWPENYEQMPLFQRLLRRRKGICEYKGEYPSVLKGLVGE